MRFNLSFSMDNAAFFDDDATIEVRRILDDTALSVAADVTEGRVYDINGNKIGHWEVTT